MPRRKGKKVFLYWWHEEFFHAFRAVDYRNAIRQVIAWEKRFGGPTPLPSSFYPPDPDRLREIPQYRGKWPLTDRMFLHIERGFYVTCRNKSCENYVCLENIGDEGWSAHPRYGPHDEAYCSKSCLEEAQTDGSLPEPG